MQGCQWEIHTPDPTATASLQAAYSLSPLTASILAARGETIQTADALLATDHSTLCDPMLLCGIELAVQEIFAAIEREELLCVYGDYDCDGVAATAMLKSYFDSIGARSCYYIPQRETEGYGLNCAAIKILHGLGVSLIVTVDNGISAIDEIAYANSLGMRVVVTDHHQPRESLPAAAAVVNPHRRDCPYPNKNLCGAGVAFKLLSAMEGERGEALLEQYADFLTIGTVADVVELSGENRLFVQAGLPQLADSYRPGIRALLELAGLSDAPLTAERVSFGISPRINAAGRIASADIAVELLLTEQESEAAEYAAQLEGWNQQRKAEEQKVAVAVAAQIAENPSVLEQRLLLFSGEGWHAGVVGIVCSRLTERYGKPCLLVATENGSAKGSGRSVEGFSLIEAIMACSDRLTHYGGHPMAAGFSLAAVDISAFFGAMLSFAKEHFPVMPAPRLTVDLALSPQALTVEEIDSVAVLEPFGAGNPAPVCMVEGATLRSIQSLSQGKHAKLLCEKEGVPFSVLWFGRRPETIGACVGDPVDVAFSLGINEYQGRRSPSLKYKGLRLSGCDTVALWEGEQRYAAYRLRELCTPSLIPSREEMAAVYRFLRGQGSPSLSESALYCHLVRQTSLSYPHFRIALDVLLEMGLLYWNDTPAGKRLAVSPAPQKVHLEDASIIKELKQHHVNTL